MALLAAIFFFGLISFLVGLYIDTLWFESLGFESVFWYGIKAQGVAFGVFFIATFVALWAGFHLVLAVTGPARQAFLEFQGRMVAAPSPRAVKKIARWIVVVLALVVAAIFSSAWLSFARLLNQPQVAGVVDPIFGRPLNFYLFTLPVLEVASVWLLLVSATIVIAAAVVYGLGMTLRLRGLSLAGSLVLTAIALRMFLARYQLLLEDHSLFSGVQYVDHKVYAVALLLTSITLILAAGAMALNVSNRIRSVAAPLLLPAAVYLVGGMLIPAYVTTFVVRPNQLVREKPYIRYNIDATRKAFGLDNVEVIPFEPRQTNTTFDARSHASTLANMRLWDWQALRDTLLQIQVIRTYYDFPDVDIDRYIIDGKLTSTMLASREIDIEKLPAGSRNWVNERLIYTHGYGVTMNAASRFTSEGLPDFLLSNMPVQGPRPEIQVKRPEIYFGELTNWPVYVNTAQKEFNYPEGDANNYTSYGGTGGIRMGSLLRRLLLASEVGDLSTVPFSNDIGPDSALLLHRNIIERASRLAPFLTFDDDPYMVIGEDGALYWILDAYTTSDRYPYSRHVAVGRRSVNYMRNSVKAVIDAYNGKVAFYVFDEEDPLINVHRKIFPDLFQPKSAMPAFLASHVRYPELLFEAQAMMYSAYHVDNEQVFYGREDVWSLAQQTRGQGNGQASESTQPTFVLMTFPGESKLEFVSILSFTPSKRNNMIGWLAGRSDGDAYGKLRAYHLPKTKFVDGPLQIQAKIDQDSQLSSQLTLWNQQGSRVIRGNLLVIPIDDVLLFAEPIYLQAERSPMPALRLIVLATQDRLAYATTFDEALKLLLQGRGGSLAQPSVSEQPPSTPAGAKPTPGASVSILINRANQALVDYRRLTSEGKLAEAGAKLDEIKNVLEELNRLSAAGK
jgi:hypothetical protein